VVNIFCAVAVVSAAYEVGGGGCACAAWELGFALAAGFEDDLLRKAAPCHRVASVAVAAVGAALFGVGVGGGGVDGAVAAGVDEAAAWCDSEGHAVFGVGLR